MHTNEEKSVSTDNDLNKLAILSLISTFNEMKDGMSSLQKQLRAMAKRHGIKLVTPIGIIFAIAAACEVTFRIDYTLINRELGFFPGWLPLT